MIKMFSTNYLFAYVVFLLAHMTLLFISDPCDKHANLTAQWNQIRSLNTGYVNDNPEMSTSMADMSNRQLRQAIIWKFEQLKCSYLFSAHFHFLMLRKIRETQLSPQIILQTRSFLAQSEIMVRSLFVDKSYIQMDEVWSVFRYTLKMFKSGYKNINDLVFYDLEAYLEANCDDENFFNVKSNICMHYKDNDKKGLELIAKNEITYTNLYDLVYNKFLYKKDLMKFCELFLGPNDWRQLAPIVNFYQQMLDSDGLQSVLYLGKFTLMLQDIFKVCTLRIAYQYLSDIKNGSSMEKSINTNVKDLRTCLTNIVSALYLNHNDFFYELDRFLQRYSMHYKKKVIKMMEDIEYNHTSISIALVLQHRKGIPGFQISQLKDFIKELSDIFKDSLARQLFKSYMQFVENKGRHLEKLIFNKKSDEHVIRLIFV